MTFENNSQQIYTYNIYGYSNVDENNVCLMLRIFHRGDSLGRVVEMKKLKLWHVLFSIGIGLGTATVASYPAVKDLQVARAETFKQMSKLKAQLNKAVMDRDFAKLQQILAEDFELYTSGGEVISKQNWIKNIQKGAMNYASFSRSSKENELVGYQFTVQESVRGSFFGMAENNYNIEMTITTVQNGDHHQIKRMSVKLLK